MQDPKEHMKKVKSPNFIFIFGTKLTENPLKIKKVRILTFKAEKILVRPDCAKLMHKVIIFISRRDFLFH